MPNQKRSARIHELELKHQDALHQTTLVTKDEDARRLKLKAHLLKDSKSTLQDQVSEKDEHISQISLKYQRAVSELRALRDTVRKQDAQIKSQARDFAHLQVSAVSCGRYRRHMRHSHDIVLIHLPDRAPITRISFPRIRQAPDREAHPFTGTQRNQAGTRARQIATLSPTDHRCREARPGTPAQQPRGGTRG